MTYKSVTTSLRANISAQSSDTQIHLPPCPGTLQELCIQISWNEIIKLMLPTPIILKRKPSLKPALRKSN